MSFALAETVQALHRAYEAAGRGARPRTTGVPPPQLMRRLGGLLAEAVGARAVRALATASQGEAAKEHGLPLVIEAEQGRLDGLPWEALTLPGQSAPLALHPTIRPYRSFGDHHAPTSLGGPDRPLRLLVLLAGPRKAPGRREPLLDLDAETARLAAAVSRVPGRAELRVLSSGSLTALSAALAEKPADVVHIVCHARPGELLLEDEAGDRDPVTADALWRALCAAHGVPAVVLAGCSTASSVSRSATGPEPAHHSRFLPGLAQSLTQSGVPAVVAMSAPVRDTYAGALMADMYAALAAGRPLWEALHDARTEQERLRRAGNDWLPEWHVPLLFAGPRTQAVEPDRGDASTGAASPEVPLALPLGSFVGRRAQLRVALNTLADDGTGLVVHGVGGVGKTAFVGELLRLRASSAPPVLLKGPVGPDEILRGAADALAGETDDPRMFELVDAEQPWSGRLAALAHLTGTDAHAGAAAEARPTAAGSTRSLTVVLDDFEANLTRDPEGRTRFTDPELADFLTAWTTLLTGASLVIVSRHPLPTTAGPASRRLRRLPLPPLTPDETDLMRLRLPLSRKLPRTKWQEIRQVVGGHPRTYAYLEALLGAGRPTDDLVARVGRLNGGLDAARARVRGQVRPALREALSLTAADTLLGDLLSSLDPTSRALLHRAAVHRVPVPASAFTGSGDAEGSGGTGDTESTEGTGDTEGTRARLDALAASGLLAEDGTGPAGAPLWSVHRWTAAELDRLDPRAAHDAHRRAAAYTEEIFSDTGLPEPVRIDAAFESLHHLVAVQLHREAGVLGRRLCGVLHARGRWTTERALCRRMLEWSEPGTESEAIVHRQLGLIARDRGDMKEAREHLERALSVSTAAGDRLGIAYAEHQLGSVEHEQGDHRIARARYSRARTAFHELGLERDAAAALYQLSMLNADSGRPAEARAGFEEAQEIFTRLEDLGAVSACHRSLAFLAEDDGDLDTAMAHCRSALGLCERTGDVAQAEELRNQIGTLYVLTENYEAAHAEFDAALRSATARDATEEMARSHQHLGVCAERMGALEIAEEHTRTALELNRELERVAAQAQCLRRLAGLARLRGRPAYGLSYARRALVLLGRTDETTYRPDTYLTIGDCLRDLGRLTQARRFYTSGLHGARNTHTAEGARAALAELEVDSKQKEGEQ
ncbi:CHAT domain-containing protein [Streptomyces akebiae]|uniref:Tetratricopeptide repeat protein n=1 Tax=Streptomyces akebiae TaxID=2865673 RepID=A0ABX8XX82_9ACTN|nr:CHAT domain-containing protein [Streptomyces akebiae]QYX80536.1 tetratricopeptide repeat protein [Streptomyces akebiae]